MPFWCRCQPWRNGWCVPNAKSAMPGFPTKCRMRIGERLTAVLHVIYLIFTEGYQSSTGATLLRRDLCDEAIRLGRVLSVLLARERRHIPDSAYAEALGLLALMLLHDARSAARTGQDGTLVRLADQDRRRWNQHQIDTGLGLLDTAMHLRQPGPYQIQAAISALHAQAAKPEATDWRQIVALYTTLLRYTPTPIILLNRAVAIGMACGAEVGLRALTEIEPEPVLQSYAAFHLARADLFQRLGRSAEARHAYQRALECCQNAVERMAIEQRLEAL